MHLNVSSDRRQATAFEELVLIANNNKERRQTIYSEQGNGTSVWNQILRASLELLADVKKRHQLAERTLDSFMELTNYRNNVGCRATHNGCLPIRDCTENTCETREYFRLEWCANVAV